jgi:hypothetical protein
MDYTNYIYFSGISSNQVYKTFGFDFKYPGTDIVTNDAEFVGKEDQYVELDLYLSEGAPWSTEASFAYKIPILTNDSYAKLGESFFQIIDKERYDNNKWGKWGESLTLARCLDWRNPYEDVIVHDIKYVSQEYAEDNKKSFDQPRVFRHLYDIDKVVYNTFSSYNECLSKFTNIGEGCKEFFEKSFTGFTYEYVINIHDDDYIYTDGEYYYQGTDWSGGEGFWYAQDDYYKDTGGMYNTTGCHFSIIMTHTIPSAFYGIAKEFSTRSCFNFNNNLLLGDGPTLNSDELEKFAIKLIMHELGHNLGLDHTFSDAKAKWVDLFPDLPLNGLDNLYRYTGVVDEEERELTFNDGNSYIAYSGEAPGKSAIMSYDSDPSCAFGCPINPNVLLDPDFDTFSGGTRFQDYPFNQIKLGTLFLNRGRSQDLTNNQGKLFYYSGSNLNLSSYMVDGEFVEGEITGMTLNFTATTAVQKLKNPYFENPSTPDFLDDESWTDLMTYTMYFTKNNTRSKYPVYTKNSSTDPPENSTGITTNISVPLTGTVWNIISQGFLDYTDLSTNGIFIQYFSGAYSYSGTPSGTTIIPNGSNVVLELDDLNLEIHTTGGTFTRKASGYNNFFTGYTESTTIFEEGSIVQRVGIQVPQADKYISYEREAAEFMLRNYDRFFALSQPTSDQTIKVEQIFYYLFDDIGKQTLAKIDITKDSVQSTYDISDLRIENTEIIDILFAVVESQTYLFLLQKESNEKFYLTKHLVLDYLNLNLVNESVKTTTINLDSYNGTLTLLRMSLYDNSNIIISTDYYSNSPSFLVNVVGSTNTTVEFDLDSQLPYGSGGITSSIRANLSGTTYYHQYWSSGYNKRIYQNHETFYNGNVFAYDITQSLESSEEVTRIFYYSWDGSNNKINVITDQGRMISLDGNNYTGSTYTITGTSVIRQFDDHQIISISNLQNFSNTYDIAFDLEQYYLRGLNSDIVYVIEKERCEDELTIGTIVSGNTYISYTFTGDYLRYPYVNNQPITQNEKFYEVISLDDAVRSKYFDYYNRQITRQPSYSGTSFFGWENPNIERGEINYTFDTVDYGDNEQIVPFTGTIRVLVLIYVWDDDEVMNEDGRPESTGDFVCALSEEMLNEEIDLGFKFEFNYEIINSSHEWYLSLQSPSNPSNGIGIDDFQGWWYENYGSVYEYNQYHYCTLLQKNGSNTGNIGGTLLRMSTFTYPSPGSIMGTYFHELGHMLGLRHSFDNVWGEVFPELGTPYLDPGRRAIASLLGYECCKGGNQILPYYNEFIDSDLHNRKISIMSYAGLGSEGYNAPNDAQILLDVKILEDRYNDTFTNITPKSNVTYYEFITEGDEILEYEITGLTISYRAPESNSELENQIRLVNTGNTLNQVILDRDTVTSSGEYTKNLNQDEIQGIYLSGDPLSLGIEIKRFDVSEESNVGDFDFEWKIYRGDLKITFIDAEGNQYERLPKDCFTIAPDSSIIHNYVDGSIQPLQVFTSYEREVIKNNINNRFQNYLNLS